MSQKRLYKILYIHSGVEEKTSADLLEKISNDLPVHLVFTVVSNGFTALECLAIQNYDLIFLQREIQFLNFDEFKKIVFDLGLSSIPIIPLIKKPKKGQASLQLAEEGVKNVDFLHYPFTKKEFGQLIMTLFWKIIMLNSAPELEDSMSENLDAHFLDNTTDFMNEPVLLVSHHKPPSVNSELLSLNGSYELSLPPNFLVDSIPFLSSPGEVHSVNAVPEGICYGEFEEFADEVVQFEVSNPLKIVRPPKYPARSSKVAANVDGYFNSAASRQKPPLSYMQSQLPLPTTRSRNGSNASRESFDDRYSEFSGVTDSMDNDTLDLLSIGSDSINSICLPDDWRDDLFAKMNETASSSSSQQRQSSGFVQRQFDY